MNMNEEKKEYWQEPVEKREATRGECFLAKSNRWVLEPYCINGTLKGFGLSRHEAGHDVPAEVYDVPL
jgi:hypothetical protein